MPSCTPLSSVTEQPSQTGLVWALSGSRHYATACDLTRQSVSFFLCVFGRALSLKPRPLPASKLNVGFHPFESLLAAALAAWLVRSAGRRQSRVEAGRLDRRTGLRAARVRWSHWRRAAVLSSLQCHHLPLRKGVFRHHFNELLGADFRASSRCFAPVSWAVEEQAHSAESHGLQGRRQGLRLWHLSRRKLLRCRLAG